MHTSKLHGNDISRSNAYVLFLVMQSVSIFVARLKRVSNMGMNSRYLYKDIEVNNKRC